MIKVKFINTAVKHIQLLQADHWYLVHILTIQRAPFLLDADRIFV